MRRLSAMKLAPGRANDPAQTHGPARTRGPARRGRLFLGGAALLCGVLLLALRAAADDPRPLSRGLPAGAVVMLETEDLRGLLQRWRESDLRKGYERSALAKEFARSKLALRLLDRLDKLEQSAGTALGLDELLRGSGRRAAFGLYDIGETSFVLATDLPPELQATLRGQKLAGIPGLTLKGDRPQAEPREHRGLPYLVVPEEGTGMKRRPPLCLALLGTRLLVGNDLARFQDALVLSARELGQRLGAAPAAASGRPEPKPADEDAVHRALAPALRLSARDDVRIYVAAGALHGNRYFDRYWIFGADSATGVSGALLSASLTGGPEGLRETRAYVYDDGAAPPLAASAPTKDDGRADLARLTSALPAGPYAQVALADAADAANAVAELLPQDKDRDARKPGSPLQELLAAAGPQRIVEVAEPKAAGLLSQHRGALALLLTKPAALDADAFERTLLGGVAAALGVGHGGPPLRFEAEGAARVLRLPLFGDYALSWQKQGDALLVASDPAGLQALAQLATLPQLLKAGAPLLRKVELDRAASTYQGVMRVLRQRDNWGSKADRDLYVKVVGGLPDIVKPVRRLLSATYRLPGTAAPLVIEEVRYLP